MAHAPVPQISNETRMAGLAKATATRKERAEIKQRVKHGNLKMADVLAMDGVVVLNMKVLDLLASRPGWGKKTAMKWMEKAGIAQSRRIRGLGANQRVAIMALDD